MLQIINKFLSLKSFSNADDVKIKLISLFNGVDFILPMVIGFYLLSNNYLKTIKLVLLFSIAFLCITSITSAYGLIVDPLAAKEMASGMQGDAKYLEYLKKNIGGFTIVYMIPLVIPMIFTLYKTNKINLLQFIIVVIPMIYYVYSSSYAIALMITLISILASFITIKYSKMKFIFLQFALILAFFVLKPVIGYLLHYYAGNTDSFELSIRMNALGDEMTGIKSTNEEYESRQEAYDYSIDMFLSDPIFGGLISGRRASGGHSFILDILASYGVAGILALYLTYRQILLFFYKPFKSHIYFGYMLLSFYLSIILALVNTSANIFVIGLFVPLVAYILQNNIYSTTIKDGNIRPAEL
ncbi:MAG: hypothetical protein Q8M15_01750 [Bacteroidota bacterium]|nr:hypothetical protein [Bacteroidota bacterium]